MKSHRRKLSGLAVLATSATAVLAATVPAHASNPGSAGSPLTASDGTDHLIVGGTAVTFPGPVSDAAWSPDGSSVRKASRFNDYSTLAARSP